MKGVLRGMLLCAVKWNCQNNRLLLSVNQTLSILPEKSELRTFLVLKGHLVYLLGIIFMITLSSGPFKIIKFFFV